MGEASREKMKNGFKRLIYVTTAIALTVATILLTKVNLTDNVVPGYTTLRNPVESFIFVKKQIVHIPRTCIPLSEEDPCHLYDNDRDGMIDPIEVDTSRSAASSGSIIGHNTQLSESYTLTAYHVCANIRGPEFMSVLVQPEIDDRTSQDWVPPHVLIIEVVGKFTITDYYGRTFSAEFMRGDRKNDICILKSGIVEGVRPIKIADAPAPPNSKVYNIASPRSLSTPGAVLTFEGYISGTRPSGFHMFTFPVGPGSSGSPVLNEYGEIVSIVSHGYPWVISRIGWEANVAGGPTWKSLHDLVKPYQIQ